MSPPEAGHHDAHASSSLSERQQSTQMCPTNGLCPATVRCPIAPEAAQKVETSDEPLGPTMARRVITLLQFWRGFLLSGCVVRWRHWRHSALVAILSVALFKFCGSCGGATVKSVTDGGPFEAKWTGEPHAELIDIASGAMDAKPTIFVYQFPDDVRTQATFHSIEYYGSEGFDLRTDHRWNGEALPVTALTVDNRGCPHSPSGGYADLLAWNVPNVLDDELERGVVKVRRSLGFISKRKTDETLGLDCHNPWTPCRSHFGELITHHVPLLAGIVNIDEGQPDERDGSKRSEKLRPELSLLLSSITAPFLRYASYSLLTLAFLIMVAASMFGLWSFVHIDHWYWRTLGVLLALGLFVGSYWIIGHAMDALDALGQLEESNNITVAKSSAPQSRSSAKSQAHASSESPS
jgi:hypothetical protein